MDVLVWLLGFFGVMWGGSIIVTIVEGNYDLIWFGIFVEICLIALFVICFKRYRNPEYQAKLKEKRRKSQEAWAKIQADEAKRKQREAEAERRRTTVVSTWLLGGYTAQKKKTGNMLKRGAIGGLLGGTAGAALGMATAKNKNQQIRVFLVKYLDGHLEEKEAAVGTAEYEEYMEHLEWEE